MNIECHATTTSHQTAHTAAQHTIVPFHIIQTWQIPKDFSLFGFYISWSGIWNMMPFHLIVDKFSFYFFISPHWVTHPSYVIMANKRKMNNIVFPVLLEWTNTEKMEIHSSSGRHLVYSIVIIMNVIFQTLLENAARSYCVVCTAVHYWLTVWLSVCRFFRLSFFEAI